MTKTPHQRIKSKLHWFLWSISVLVSALLGKSGHTQPIVSSLDLPHSQARIIKDTSPQNDSPATAFLLEISTDPDWYIYWKNPGESGQAPEIEWTSLDSLSASRIEFPIPQRVETSGIENFVYPKGSITRFLFTLRAEDSEAWKSSRKIAGVLSYLVCKVQCVPATWQFEMNLSPTDAISETELAHFSTTRKKLPKSWTKEHGPKIDFESQTNEMILTLSGAFDEVTFFPDPAQPWEIDSRSDYTEIAGAIQIRHKTKTALVNGENLGLLNANGETWALRWPEAVSQPIGTQRLVLLMLMAFLGGVVLNLMPCVLPVLALKALSLSSGVKSQRIRFMSAAGYQMGLWVFLLILAIGSRLAGASTWGFQLQNPVFVTSMAILFFGFALFLLFDFALFDRVAAYAQGLDRNGGFWGSFSSGALAVLVATPCTAPFMGSAIAVALLASWAESIIIFLALGLGLGLPMIALIIWPKTHTLFPKPGPWMSAFKKLLALPMFLTALWLGYVAWTQTLPDQESNQTQKDDLSNWKKFDPQALEAALNRGQSVFIDFTADWCLSCKVNERLVLNTESVQALFKENGTLLLKADWTKEDPVVTAALERFGRRSVPLYVFYPESSKEPRQLPEILTKGMIEDLFVESVNK